MKIVLGNLPNGVEKADIESLVEEYSKVKSAEILADDASESDNIEYLVTLEDESRVGADAIVGKLNGYTWKGVQITARVLLFQDDTDPSKT